MTPKKITAFTANTTPQPTDITVMVDDPGGSPLTQKITLANLMAVTNALTEDTSPDTTADLVPVYDASAAAMKKVLLSNILRQVTDWVPVTGTWSYASANTITVPSGAASIYKKGMGIRITQSATVKYFYITTVANTLLTVTGGTDYTVANSAISSPGYTFVPHTAIGFPVKFTCAAPTWSTATIDSGTGGVQPTAGSSTFIIRGNKVELFIALGGSGVVKNGAGTTLAVSAIPATLPSIVAPTVGLVGYGIITTAGPYLAVAYYNSATSFTLLSNTSIADNASVALSNMQIEYEY